jgi:hypothetical protein
MAEQNQSDLIKEPPIAPEVGATDALLDPKYRAAFAEQEAKQKPLIEELGFAEREKARIEREGVESGQAKMKEGFATYQEQIKTPQEFIRKGFEPTRENATDLTALFATTAVAAFMGGGGGRYSGMAALNNMAGAMEGYRKGRKDLFERELKEFDKNFKAAQTALQTASDELKSVVEIAKLDPVLAQSKAKEYAAKYAGTKLAYDFNKGSFDQKIKTATEIDKAVMKMKEAIAKTEGKGVLKPGAKVGEGYVSLNILSNDLAGLRQDLRNPALQNQIREYRIESFLTEEGKVLNQLISGNIPAELRQFLTKVRDVRNNYYLDISGKAVTGAEALRNYGTVPQPGDAPEVMDDKIAGMEGRVNGKIKTYQTLYGLPTLPREAVAAGTQTALVPGQNYEQPDKPVPVISTREQYDALDSGTEYFEIDAAGNRTKFRKP